MQEENVWIKISNALPAINAVSVQALCDGLMDNIHNPVGASLGFIGSEALHLIAALNLCDDEARERFTDAFDLVMASAEDRVQELAAYQRN